MTSRTAGLETVSITDAVNSLNTTATTSGPISTTVAAFFIGYRRGLMPVQYAVFLIAVVAVTSVAAALVSGRTIQRQRRRRFVGRVAVSDDEFFARFCRGSELRPDEITAIRQETGRTFDVPHELLLPEDRFDQELAPVAGWEFMDKPLGELGLAVARITRQPIDLTGVRSLDDLIRMALSRPES